MAKRGGSKRPAERVIPRPADAQKPPPPRPFGPPPGPAADAVALFQRGMEALQRHAYSDATTAFQAVVMGYPGETALLDRARVYLELCERESQKRPVAPKTIEERLTAATAALNDGRDDDAEELARNVLGDDPRHDLALYLLAALLARRGAKAEALDLLGKAIALSPEASTQARADEDFVALHDEDAFWTLTEPPIVPPGTRRRRPRVER